MGEGQGWIILDMPCINSLPHNTYSLLLWQIHDTRQDRLTVWPSVVFLMFFSVFKNPLLDGEIQVPVEVWGRFLGGEGREDEKHRQMVLYLATNLNIWNLKFSAITVSGVKGAYKQWVNFHYINLVKCELRYLPTRLGFDSRSVTIYKGQ